MKLINLVPSKKSYFNHVQLEMIVISGTLILPLIISYILYVFIQHEQTELKAQIAAYTSEIQAFKQVNVEIKSTSGGADVKPYLQATIKLWQLLGDLSEQSVCVRTVERVKNKLVIEGMAHSIYELEAYVRKLSESNLFTDIYLDKLIQQQLHHTTIYRLRLSEGMLSPMQSRVK